MTRIIAGSAGGRRLTTPPGDGTRPTSDRVREALFSALESWFGTWEGVHVLDLYAGSGAVGLEAASRGAASVVLVEHDRRTAGVAAGNARTLGLRDVEVVAAATRTALSRPPARPVDLVFSDPPYPVEDEVVDADLAALVEHGWLAEGAVVVVERSRRSREPRWPDGFGRGRRRKYGETTLWSAEWQPGTPDHDDPVQE
jgi:16S rRNA (guanine966-N2)-methyltransferase